MNTIALLGRTTAALELKQTQEGKSVVNFSLAVKRPYSKETDFITVVAWGKQAELLGKYVGKGDQICIRGYLTIRKWKDKQGNDRYSSEVIAEEISFVASKDTPAEKAYTPDAYKGGKFEDVQTDASLPF